MPRRQLGSRWRHAHQRVHVGVAVSLLLLLRLSRPGTWCSFSDSASGAEVGRRHLLASGVLAAQRIPQAAVATLPLVSFPDRAEAAAPTFDPRIYPKEVGAKVTTPNGLEYEVLSLGTSGDGPRDGFPKKASKVWVRFTGHVDSFDGKVFDSSTLRARRSTGKRDWVEITMYGEQTISNGLCEALRLMKVGEKGRFMQPPVLSYSQGAEFEGDDDSEVKKVPAGSTLYYDVELVNIIRP
mmetsp:Transcript_50033/g.119039  ORF Transcript_50033/g.119039 Transcript_50033/m.119039 type:complete len:239 (+) Transcript_50033:49-765(+)